MNGPLTSKEFEEIILKIRKRQEGAPLYRVITFDLNEQRSNKPFDLAGGYIEVIDATDSSAFMELRFNEIQNDVVRLRNGDSIVTPFFRVFLTNTAQAKSITIAVSLSYDLWRVIRSQQVLIGGELVVRDWWYEQIRAGRAFYAGTQQGGASTNCVQLHNPVGSGIIVVVRSLIGGPGAVTTAMQVRRQDTAILSSVSGVNLLAGGAASVANLRFESRAAPGGTVVAVYPAGGANVGFRYLQEWSYELGAGEGVMLNPASANVDCIATYEWIELTP